MIFLRHAEVFNPIKNSSIKTETYNEPMGELGTKERSCIFGRDRVCITCPRTSQAGILKKKKKKMMQPKEGFALGPDPQPSRVSAVLLRTRESNIKHLQPGTSQTPDLNPYLPTSTGKP